VIGALLAVLLTPGLVTPAYFEAQVMRARRNLGVHDVVRVEAQPGPIYIRLPGHKEPQPRIAYAQATGQSWLVVVDASWLATATDGQTQVVAYHEMCHVALQHEALRKGYRGLTDAEALKFVAGLEREAERCAELWMEELARRWTKANKVALGSDDWREPGLVDYFTSHSAWMPQNRSKPTIVNER